MVVTKDDTAPAFQSGSVPVLATGRVVGLAESATVLAVGDRLEDGTTTVGYRVQLKGNTLEFALGYSHPVVVQAPEGITFAVETPTKFSVTGIDKQKVGQISANIRRLRRPDPYKGKGVRYEGEQIRRKVGKTGK